MDREQRIWDIVEKTSVGMLTTRFAGGMRARPLDARPDRREGAIYFITDASGLKENEIKAAPDVCFTVVDSGDQAYLSITGRAEILRDSGLAAKYWKEADAVWWPDGPRDDHVRLLRLRPELAELWDGPASAIVAAFEFAKARVTGEKPDLGENRKISVSMERG